MNSDPIPGANGEEMTKQKRFASKALQTIAVCALGILGIGTHPAFSQQDGPVAPASAVDATDPMFKEPFIDVDEWREKPIHHRYVHGGFKGTDARFSFYFPSKERYQGRFFQHNYFHHCRLLVYTFYYLQFRQYRLQYQKLHHYMFEYSV